MKNTNSALPEVLSFNDIKTLFIRMNAGDIEAKDTIIEHNLKLVRSIALRFYNTGYDLDDLESAGKIGLINSVEEFDIDRNIQFSTFASKYIINEILHFLKANRKHRTIKNKKTTTYNEECDKEFDEELVSEENIELNYEQNENVRIIYNVLIEVYQELSPRDREIIMSFYQENLSQVAVGEKLGISHTVASNVINYFKKRAKLKLLRAGIVEQSDFNGRKQKRARSKK